MIIDSPLALVFRDLFYRLQAFAGPHDVFLKLEGFNITGSIKINFPDKEPWDLEDTCALDVAERGGITLEEVGAILNLTRERIRQVEVRGLLKLKMASALEGFDGVGPLGAAGGGYDEH